MPKFIPKKLKQQITTFFENELIRRIVKNSGYLFSTTGAAAALSMIQGILVARLLGVAGFGILGTITMFISVVNKFASFRTGELVVKYVGQYSEKQDQLRAAAVFKTALLIEIGASCLAFLLVWLTAPLGARYFAKDPNLTQYFIIYGTIVLANLVFESSTGLLQIYDSFRRIALINLVQSFATLALITLVFILQGDLLGVLIAYIVGKVIGAAGLTISAAQVASSQWGRSWWRSPINILRPQARELAHFAVSTNISASISLITKDSEILWVSLLRSPLETGYYKLALSLANLVQMPVSPMPQATYPEISRQAAKGKWSNMSYILRQGSLIAGGYTLTASVFLALAGSALVQSIYGSEFLPAYPALMILLVGLLLANTFYWRRVALLTLGRPDFPAKLNFALAIIKAAGILLLVPSYGYLASAWLLTGFYVVGSIISVLKVRSILSKKIHLTGKPAV
jgi:O-antigen/teichoic acid export membrane protein